MIRLKLNVDHKTSPDLRLAHVHRHRRSSHPCLGIVIGAQRGWKKDDISTLAAVNTGVAATIGVVKALSLPDKKGIECRKLRILVDRIRVTTRKLRAGIDVDAALEADEVRKEYQQTEEEAQFEASDLVPAATTGLKAVKKRG